MVNKLKRQLTSNERALDSSRGEMVLYSNSDGSTEVDV